MRFEIDSLLAEIAAGKPKMRWHPGTRILRQHDDPFVELDIVGESYCKASFDELRGKYEAKNSSRLNMIVELLIDPDNKFSESGSAVRALVDGHHVGFIPERTAPAIFGLIVSESVRSYIPGSIFFDHIAATPQRNSVRIASRSRGPIGAIFAGDPSAHKKQLSAWGAKSHQVNLKKPSTMATPDEKKITTQRPPAPNESAKGFWSTARVDSGRPGQLGKPQFHPNPPLKKAKASRPPVKLKFYCGKCGDDAQTAKRACARCGSTLGIARPGRKTLAASRAALVDRKAAKRARSVDAELGTPKQ